MATMKYLLILLLFLTACGPLPTRQTATVPVAQENLHNIQSTVTRIEQPLKSIDDAVKSTPEEAVVRTNTLAVRSMIKSVIDDLIKLDRSLTTIQKENTTLQEANAKLVDEQNNSLRRDIQFWSFISLGAGILLIAASFVLIKYLGGFEILMREIGIVIFIAGLFGSSLVVFFKPIMLILAVTTGVTIIATGLVLLIRVIKTKSAGKILAGAMPPSTNPKIIAAVKKLK